MLKYSYFVFVLCVRLLCICVCRMHCVNCKLSNCGASDNMRKHQYFVSCRRTAETSVSTSGRRVTERVDPLSSR